MTSHYIIVNLILPNKTTLVPVLQLKKIRRFAYNFICIHGHQLTCFRDETIMIVCSMTGNIDFIPYTNPRDLNLKATNG